MSTARQAAADALHLARVRKTFAADAVDEVCGRSKLSSHDRRFVTQLVMGVLRRRATLDALLTPFVNRPPHAVEERLWDVLQLGAFQLAFLTQIPPHAAVHDTVELAAHVGSPKAKGFVNGVLRRITELVTGEFVDYPWTDTVPVEFAPSPPSAEGGRAAERYRKLSKPVLPDPEASEPAYLSAAFSWPRWLADRWFARHGWDECRRLGFWFNAPPPLWLRVNKLRLDREAYRLQLAAALIDAEPGPHPQSLRIVDGAAVRDLPGYAAGDFAVQDVSSMAVASAVAPQPGMRVLDLCAAPGGKTTHLAELMDNRGRIVACDVEANRLGTVTSLCQRLGVKVVEPVLLGETDDPPPGPFDAALVDVPCSNTGVLGRRPEVRWRLRPNEFEHLIRLQTRLLLNALDRVKPGGHVVYSTCSIEPDENEGVVKAVLRGVRGLTVEADSWAIPGRPGDGGYWARLRKPV
jgi:16S rRNA (cytosine967-C5)-methyltransferase